MKILISTIYVDDQEKALQFYTGKLGFVKKDDVEANGYRWLTVASPEAPDGVQLQLEANANPAAKAFQQAMKQQGMPATIFAVQNLDAEHTKLAAKGVDFTLAPQDIGPAKIAQLDDGCGNLIQLKQE